MRLGICAIALCSLALTACGSDSDGPPAENPPGDTSQGFNPPPAKEGYTRLVAPVIPNLEPGADIMYCQYVMAPVDHDLDILDVGGYQSKMGHHAVAYATTAPQPLGSSGPCTGEDNLTGVFVGGIGGEAGGGVTLPEGVGFRLPAGSSIMLNTHFLNVGKSAIDGETVLDVKFVPTDPARKIASLFANGNLGFQVPARGTADATAECVMPRDMDIIIFANHMHDHGTHAMTEIERLDGTVEPIHEDPEWTYDMQFNGVYRTWPLDAPLHLAPGDKLRTYCHWSNTTEASLSFPREMCFGVSYFISDGASAPTCINGRFLE